MKNLKRKFAIVLAVIVVFAMLFLLAFVAAEAHHDCIGEGCCICCVITTVEKVEKALSASSAAVAVSAAVCFAEYIISEVPEGKNEPSTLVYLKVKLSN